MSFVRYFVETAKEFAVLLPFLTVFLLCCYYCNKKRGVKLSAPHMIVCLVFMLYVTFVLNITGSLTLDEVLRSGLTVKDGFALIPFSNVASYGFIMNILLFMPFGLIAPLVFQGYARLPKTALSGFLFSLAIECGQLFNFRASDIDDLIANTLGAVVGFVLYKAIFGRRKNIAALPSGENAYTRHEAPAVIAVVFAVRFLLWQVYYMIVIGELPYS